MLNLNTFPESECWKANTNKNENEQQIKTKMSNKK